MKLKNFAFTAVLLVALPLVLGLTVWAVTVQARPTAAFPAPSGSTGTIVEINGNFVWVKLAGTDANRTLHVRVDASTVIIKGGFSRLATLSKGDVVFVDPTFPAATGTTLNTGAPGTGSSSAVPPSTGTGDATAGRGAGSADSAGSGSKALPAGVPGSGQSAQPSEPSQSGDGTTQGRQQATAPGSTGAASSKAQPSGQPGLSAARKPVPVARLIWVTSKGETLTSGSVSAATASRVTLQAGASTFTVVIDKSTEFRRVDAAGGSILTATAADIQVGQSLLVLGTAAGGSDTVTAKTILIQPAAPGTR